MGSLLLVFGNLDITPLTNYDIVLGAVSKALATLITQPLIVAKVGLQSRPPPDRQGKPFKSFIEVMSYVIENEGLLSLFKGIAPQITKGILVQGLLMMTKERYVTQFRYLRYQPKIFIEWRLFSLCSLRICASYDPLRCIK